MKPEWPQVLCVLASNLEAFPTLDEYDRHELAVTSGLLRLAAREMEVAAQWRRQELDDLRGLLADHGQAAPGPLVDPADCGLAEMARLLDRARAEVLALHARLEGGGEELVPAGAEVGAVIRRSVERRARVLDAADWPG